LETLLLQEHYVQIPLGNAIIIRRNVWICHLGRESVDGSFEAFVDAVSTASLQIRGLDVTYDAPGLGTLEFGWDGPLTLDSDMVPLHGYPRWDNP
jgi:hypothetical protein